jgi:small subunit ribosomal protein S8
MPMTDPLGDMLTRIRNGQQARKDSVVSPASKLRVRVLDVLQREGYIRGYQEEPTGPDKGLRIELKYFEGQPAIQHCPACPSRAAASIPAARSCRASATAWASPSSRRLAGVLSDAEAREQNVGGEVLAEVF